MKILNSKRIELQKILKDLQKHMNIYQTHLNISNDGSFDVKTIKLEDGCISFIDKNTAIGSKISKIKLSTHPCKNV